MLEILQAAAKGGFRTSEFWLALVAVALPYAQNAAEKAPGTTGIVATSAVAAAYAVSRALVKRQAIAAVSTDAGSESAVQVVGSPAAAAVRERTIVGAGS
jgi:hypothetical protein